MQKALHTLPAARRSPLAARCTLRGTRLAARRLRRMRERQWRRVQTWLTRGARRPLCRMPPARLSAPRGRRRRDRLSLCCLFARLESGARPTCHRKQQILVIRNRRPDADSGLAVCSLHSATLAARWWAEPSLFPPSVTRGTVTRWARRGAGVRRGSWRPCTCSRGGC